MIENKNYNHEGVNLKWEENSVEVSVVVPISERHDDIEQIYRLYSEELKKIGKSYEFLFIVDGDFPDACKVLDKLQMEKNPLRIIKFAKHFGESVALTEGFRQAKGEIILTLASYFQVEPGGLANAFSNLDEGYDLIITRRFPRKDPWINRIQSAIYHYIINKLTKSPFKDITSGMRLIKKNILSELILYGDLHRFIPIFALHKGLKVKEVRVAQKEEDIQIRLVKPGIYVRRILDILTLFFLIKFTQKPLRFFGLIGTSLSILGLLISAYLTILRLFYGVPLSNRPLLILGIVLIVFGIQLFSLGLIGELILYSHAKDLTSYRIEKILE